MPFSQLRELINRSYDRNLLIDEQTKAAVRETIELLDKGKVRVAFPLENEWRVNEWVKKSHSALF